MENKCIVTAKWRGAVDGATTTRYRASGLSGVGSEKGQTLRHSNSAHTYFMYIHTHTYISIFILEEHKDRTAVGWLIHSLSRSFRRFFPLFFSSSVSVSAQSSVSLRPVQYPRCTDVPTRYPRRLLPLCGRASSFVHCYALC